MSTTTEAAAILPAETVTAQHVRALKHADSIVFRHYEGQTTVEAHRDGAHTSTGFADVVTIYAESTVTDYGRETSWQPADAYTCFHMEHASQFAPVAATLVGRIAAGDTLRLEWIRDNNNDLTRAAGLHVDELRIVITKKNGKRETYTVDVQVSLDNSARMIRKAR